MSSRTLQTIRDPYFLGGVTIPGTTRTYPAFAHSMAFQWAVNRNPGISNTLLFRVYVELYRTIHEFNSTPLDYITTGIASFPLSVLLRLSNSIQSPQIRDALGFLDRGDIDYTLRRTLNIAYTRALRSENPWDTFTMYLEQVALLETMNQEVIEIDQVEYQSIYFVNPVEAPLLTTLRPIITNPGSPDPFSILSVSSENPNLIEFLRQMISSCENCTIYISGFWHIAPLDYFLDHFNIDAFEEELTSFYYRDQALGLIPIYSRYPQTTERPTLTVLFREIRVINGIEFIFFESLPNVVNRLPAEIFFYFFRVFTTETEILEESIVATSLDVELISNQYLLP